MMQPIIDGQKNTPRGGGVRANGITVSTTPKHYTKTYTESTEYRLTDSDSRLIAKLEAERINDGLEVQA